MNFHIRNLHFLMRPYVCYKTLKTYNGKLFLSNKLHERKNAIRPVHKPIHVLFLKISFILALHKKVQKIRHYLLRNTLIRLKKRTDIETKHRNEEKYIVCWSLLR